MTDPKTFDLSGQAAVITGAGSQDGIGFACARQLAALGAGVTLAATSDRIHERAAELADAGAEVTSFVGDLTDPDVAEALVKEALARFASLEILVNNAGMTSVSNPGRAAGIEGISDEEWTETINRNLSTVFLVTRAAIGPMLEAGYGRVINIASVSGPVAAYRRDIGYHAAKAGVVGLTRSVAIDLADRGVTANAVAPGWIATGSATEDEVALGHLTPIGRSGTPEEVATAVTSLALRGSSYITGQVIVVDGGNSIAEERRG
jgi:3-oxoacyl-[acyl-carrier protein] reductase